MMLISTLGLILARAALLWAHLRIKACRWLEMAEKIPGPKPLPVIGNTLEFGTTAKGLLLNMTPLAHQYGTIYRFWLLPDLYVALQDPDYVQASRRVGSILTDLEGRGTFFRSGNKIGCFNGLQLGVWIVAVLLIRRWFSK